MRIIGGIAFVNQVSFLSSRFRVTAKVLDGNVRVTYRQMPDNDRMGKLYDIPIVRGLARIITLILGTRAIWYLLITLAVLDIFVTAVVSRIQSLDINWFNWSIHGLITPLDVLLLPFVVVFIKVFIAKLHGAEHKVFNTWAEGKTINLANARTASRVSERCGTNLVVFIVLIGLLLSLVFNEYITAILSVALGYELFKIKQKSFVGIAKIFYKIGSVLQYFLFTSEPGDKELEVAITAFNKLIELENTHRMQSS